MREIKIVKIDIEDFKQREMSELELYGAVMIIREAILDSGIYTSLSVEDVDSDTYYTNKQLQINEGYTCTDSDGELIKLHCVFCREGNSNMLFGYASYLDDEEDLFLVRID